MSSIADIGELIRDLSIRQVSSLPLSDIVDTLPAAIYTTDANGRIDLFNKAAVELWGRTPDREDEHWCGSLKLYHPDGRPMPHDTCPMAESLKTGKPVRGREAIAERPDGSRVNFIPYPTPIKDENGNVVGAINMLVDVTEQKQSELALTRNEARLRDFVESTTIGLHWVGPDGTVLWANKAEMDMLGFTANEYIGSHIAEFHADREVIDDILKRLTRFETIQNYEARLRCKDGSIRHVLIDSSVYTENGEFVHTRCYTRDVTFQKSVEQRLAAGARVSQILSEADSLETALKAVLHSLSAYFNADIGEIWLSENELRCVAFHSSIKGKAVDHFRTAAMNLSLAPGAGLPGHILESGKPVWLEDIGDASRIVRGELANDLELGSGFGFPIFSRGKCRGAINFFTREAEQSDPSLLVMMLSLGHKIGQFIDRAEQQETNEHLAAVIEASRDAVVSVDLDDRILSWNAGAEHLFGYTAEEAIGAHVTLLVPRRTMAARNRRIERLKRGETVEPFETIRHNKSGQPIYVSLGFSPVRDSSGNLQGVAAITRDITKRKFAEQQLKGRIQQLQAISEIGISALASSDVDAVFSLAVSQLARGLGVEYAKVLELQPGGELLLRTGIGWRKGLVGKATVGTDLDSQAGYTLSVPEPVVVEDMGSETRFNGPPLLFEHGVVSGLSTVILGEDGEPFGVLGAHTKTRRKFTGNDVNFLQSVANILATAVQREAHQHSQDMLRQELSHRVKNNMTVVQAMARMAAQFSDSIENFLHSFEARIAALAQAHDMLIDSNWAGASLGNLHKLVLGSQVAKGRIRLKLTDLTLDPEATQALTMVIYELMTNASKYGALSNNTGTISITGKKGRDGDTPVYNYTWRETGGPPVSKPTRRGYGSKLVWWTVVRKCEGKIDTDWSKSGLSVTLTFPLAAIS